MTDPFPHLYLVVDGAYCKIGISCNPKRRSREMWYPSWRDGQSRKAPIKYAWLMPGHAGYIETAVCKAMGPFSIGTTDVSDWFEVPERRVLAVIRKEAAIRIGPDWHKETVLESYDGSRNDRQVANFLGAGWSLATLRREFKSSGRARGRRKLTKPQGRK